MAVSKYNSKFVSSLSTTLQLVLEFPSTSNVSFKPVTLDSMRLLEFKLVRAYHALPPALYSQAHSHLLRMVSSLMLDGPTTSLLPKLLHSDDVSLGPWGIGLDGVEEALLEAFEPVGLDASVVWTAKPEFASFATIKATNVRVVDVSVQLFAVLFVAQSDKNRLQLLTHVNQCIKDATTNTTRASMQTNAMCSMFLITKQLSRSRTPVGKGEVLTAIQKFIHPFIADADTALRRASCEALGMLCRSEGDSVTNNLVRSIAELVKKPAKDVMPSARAGAAFTLACIQRYVGGMMSQTHLPSTVSTLHVLAQDTSSNLTAMWAMHALTITIQCSGLNFSSFATPTLMLVSSLLLTDTYVAGSHPTAYSHLGRVVNAIVGALGPELEPVSPTMHKCNAVCGELEAHSHPLVRYEAIAFKQRLIMFAPRVVQPQAIYPFLVSQLKSPYITLRGAAVTCLRQLVQTKPESCAGMIKLATILFDMLDHEHDTQLHQEIQHLITTLLDMSAGTTPSVWLRVCKSVVTASKHQDLEEDEALTSKPLAQPAKNMSDKVNVTDEDEDEEENEGSRSGGMAGTKAERNIEISYRGYTKVFAMDCVRRVISVCKSTPVAAHFDLSLARQASGLDTLVLRLHELVGMAFNAGTSVTDSLRPIGVWTLKDIVEAFAPCQDPDYEGHGLLELYQAQITSALRPAFAPDAQPQLTAVACEVLVTYVDNSFMVHTPTVLQKIMALLISPLANLRQMSYPSYSEKMVTLVQLALLGALARLYAAGNAPGHSENVTKIIPLLQSSLPLLRANWMAALRDYAMVNAQPAVPVELYKVTFHSRSTAREIGDYYADAFPLILRAASSLVGTPAWYQGRSGSSHRDDGEEQHSNDEEDKGSSTTDDTDTSLSETAPEDDFYVLLGLSLRALTNQSVPDRVSLCIHSCSYLLHSDYLTPHKFPHEECRELVTVLSKLTMHDEVAVRSATASVFLRLVSNVSRDYFSEDTDTTPSSPQSSSSSSPSLSSSNSSITQPSTRMRDMLLHDIVTVCVAPLHQYLHTGPHQVGQTAAYTTTHASTEVTDMIAIALTSLAKLSALLPPPLRARYDSTLLFTCLRATELAHGSFAPVLSYALIGLTAWARAPSGTTTTSTSSSSSSDVSHDLLVEHETTLHGAVLTVLKTFDFSKMMTGVDPFSKDSSQPLIAALAALVTSFQNTTGDITDDDIHDRVIGELSNALIGQSGKVRATAAQTVRMIVQAGATHQPETHSYQLAMKYLREMGPALALGLVSFQDYDAHESPLAQPEQRELTEDDVSFAGEAVKVLVLANALASEEHKLASLQVLIPSLVCMLRPATPAPSPIHAQLHTTAIQIILHLATNSPVGFRSIMPTLPPSYKSLLESSLRQALLAQQQAQQQAQSATQAKETAQQRTTDFDAPKPAPLKLDFSKYG
eukprot:TRINITY_DN4514_c0_g1_i5.p1 TRINITY_DN4514_c0_g1~~TRINITY_DN4514_c0_g1_i5.p1  ORF type:complete len:1605 (-),score=389.94 TRINITY_DN4514_c0_g1_i5:24-4304(-)